MIVRLAGAPPMREKGALPPALMGLPRDICG